MFKIYCFILFSLLSNLYIPFANAEKNEVKIKSDAIKKLYWEFSNSITENYLNWDEVDKEEINKEQIKIKNIVRKTNVISVRSIGKGVTVNGSYYSDISNYVPNGYVEDPNKLFGLSTRGISKTRFCNGKNFSKNCIDGVLDFDFKLFNNNDLSIFPKINVQSLSSRGTNFGEGSSLGVKIAKELSSNWSIAFGGENIFHFDETIDLGHNFFVISSTYFPLMKKKFKYPVSKCRNRFRFYGYRGNGFLFRTPCGQNTLTGN